MEYPGIKVDTVTSGIQRRVKGRIAKTNLNVSLASKIKAKILNNSSIFKISLKHNNRALARALSKEKENSRRITTEKMQLQKEVEKLNFENTFLRLKLNTLNKKLVEIESHVSNDLLTAIEISSLSEFHQGSFLLSATKKQRNSKQCKPAHLPYARVLLTSENDDDDGADDKWQTKCNNRTISKTSPDSTSSVSRQPSSLHQCNLKAFPPKEDNQKTCGSGHLEHTSSVDILPNESHSDQSPKSSLSEMKTAPSPSLRREKLSHGNVTMRKKCVSSTPDILYVTDLDHQPTSSPGSNWNNEIHGHTNETSNNTQRNAECFLDLPSESSSEPDAKRMELVQKNTDSFHFQKTVYDAADMELTATDIGKIVAVSKSKKNQNKKKADCRKETFRKVKGASRPAKAVSKMTPKSKKRKLPLGCSPETHGTVEITPNTDLAKAVDSQQTEKENYLEKEKIAKRKPDFCTKVLKLLSETCSSNIKNSSLDSMCKSSLPLSISSRKTLMLEESSSLESTCIFQVGDAAHEKITTGTRNPHHRTQKSTPGSRTSLVLVDTSSVSDTNPANPENESEGQSSHPMRRKRQCVPLNLTEPSLRSKMRR